LGLLRGVKKTRAQRKKKRGRERHQNLRYRKKTCPSAPGKKKRDYYKKREWGGEELTIFEGEKKDEGAFIHREEVGGRREGTPASHAEKISLSCSKVNQKKTKNDEKTFSPAFNSMKGKRP